MSRDELERIELEKFCKAGMIDDTLTKEDLLFIIAKKNQSIDHLEEEIKKLSELFTRILRSDLDLLLEKVNDAKEIGSSVGQLRKEDVI